jgi:RNA polymerase sigma-70 factor (ECF subfamily)
MNEETMATEEFEQLVDAHYQALYRFGMSLTKDPDRAADLVQQTFCKWAEKGRQLRDRNKAKSWLFTTLHRDFLSRIRRSNRFREEGLDQDEIEQIADETTVTAERQMDGKRVLELLHELDETFRAPLALFYLQQHGYKEIAVILDVPIGTVMSRIARGKELLRRKMTAEPASAPKNVLQIEHEERRENHG